MMHDMMQFVLQCCNIFTIIVLGLIYAGFECFGLLA